MTEEHETRSASIRKLVQRTEKRDDVTAPLCAQPKRRIVQFWDDLARLPNDVGECIESWRRLQARGFEVHLFDTDAATEFIATRLGPRHQRAFERCYHPAMQSDYFRLCYVLLDGG